MNVDLVDEQRPWLAELPRLVHDIRQRWRLRLGTPYPGGTCAWVAPAELPGGAPAVLKISWPHREAAGEAEGLRLYGGRGAVRVYRHDPDRWALLLERCDPGTKLGDLGRVAKGSGGVVAERAVTARLQAAARVLKELHDAPVPPGTGLDRLGDRMAGWADLAEERMARLRPDFDPGLVRLGIRLLRELPATAGREVVVHGDFNPGNILAVRGRGWSAIDPKPMVGDGAYDPWPLVEQVDDPFTRPRARQLVNDRFAIVADVLGADPRRLFAWSVARCVEDALWTVEHGDPRGGGELMAKARLLADLATA
jgi:streptomycin 6-kinase